MTNKVQTAVYEQHTIEIYIDHDPAAYPRRVRKSRSKIATADNEWSFGEELPLGLESIGHAFLSYLKQRGLCINDVVFLDVYVLDQTHSNCSFSVRPFPCEFGGRQIGFIYETKKNIREEFGVDYVSAQLEYDIHRRLDDEVGLLSTYYSEGCYRYVVKNAQGQPIDAAGGFYGTDFAENGLMDYAKDTIKKVVEQKQKHHSKKVKGWIKHSVPLIYRKPLVASYT